jgi:hypothetical protein
VPPIPRRDQDSSIRIVGFDKDANGDTVVCYKVEGIDGVQQATRADFSAMHQRAFAEFLEKASAKKT